MNRLVAHVRSLYLAHEWGWCLPLIYALSDRTSTRAASWVERSVSEIIPLVETPHRLSLMRDLEQLPEYKSKPASCEEFYQKTDEIWYRQPSRDFAQTAVSKLFGLIAHEIHGDGRRYRHLYTAPIAVLLEGAGWRLDLFEIAVREFRVVLHQWSNN